MMMRKEEYFTYLGGAEKMLREYKEFVAALEGKTLTKPLLSYTEYWNSRFEDYRFAYGCRC